MKLVLMRIINCTTTKFTSKKPKIWTWFFSGFQSSVVFFELIFQRWSTPCKP